MSKLPCRLCKSESPRYVFGNRCSDCESLTYNEALDKRYAAAHQRLMERLTPDDLTDSPCIIRGQD